MDFLKIKYSLRKKFKPILMISKNEKSTGIILLATAFSPLELTFLESMLAF
jgi:hypothetical protein